MRRSESEPIDYNPELTEQVMAVVNRVLDQQDINGWHRKKIAAIVKGTPGAIGLPKEVIGELSNRGLLQRCVNGGQPDSLDHCADYCVVLPRDENHPIAELATLFVGPRRFGRSRIGNPNYIVLRRPGFNSSNHLPQ